VDCFGGDTAKNKPKVVIPRSLLPLSLVTVLFVGFPPAGDDACSFSPPFFSPGFTIFYSYFFSSDYSLSITPSSFLFFFLAFPASVLGMYFLGDGMDRDRLGGFGHDLALLLKFPLRFRVVSLNFL
jgi:hypothetical protein